MKVICNVCEEEYNLNFLNAIFCNDGGTCEKCCAFRDIIYKRERIKKEKEIEGIRIKFIKQRNEHFKKIHKVSIILFKIALWIETKRIAKELAKEVNSQVYHELTKMKYKK